MESVLAMMFRWDTITPRGVPVDPEVNIRAATSSGPTSAAGPGSLPPPPSSSRKSTGATPASAGNRRSVTRCMPANRCVPGGKPEMYEGGAGAGYLEDLPQILGIQAGWQWHRDQTRLHRAEISGPRTANFPPSE